MAVPKRRTSRSNTRSRRAQWTNQVKPANHTACPACGAAKMQHVACETCGQYNGRQVIEVS